LGELVLQRKREISASVRKERNPQVRIERNENNYDAEGDPWNGRVLRRKKKRGNNVSTETKLLGRNIERGKKSKVALPADR